MDPLPASRRLLPRYFHAPTNSSVPVGTSPSGERGKDSKRLECFQKASADNPSDHRAFESIARTHLMLGMYGVRPPRESYEQLLEAQSHAIGVCGVTPEMRADRAHALHLFERNARDAKSELLQAKQEKPSATIYVRLALLYTAQRRFDLAAEALNQARATDRFWPTLPANEIFFWFCRHDFENAIDRAKVWISSLTSTWADPITPKHWSTPAARMRPWSNTALRELSLPIFRGYGRSKHAALQASEGGRKPPRF